MATRVHQRPGTTALDGADLVKAVAVENLEELKEFLVVGLGDTPAARFNAEGGLCSSFFTDH